MSATVTKAQRAAWVCPSCGSRRSVGWGMSPDSGPEKAQCVPCGRVSDWPSEHAAARTLPNPAGGCICTGYDEDRGGGHSEHMLEYEPACPKHSEHVYDPRTGSWIPLGACICDTSPNTDGPEEDCPRHGRDYSEWVERVDKVAAERDAAIRRAQDAESHRADQENQLITDLVKAEAEVERLRAIPDDVRAAVEMAEAEIEVEIERANRAAAEVERLRAIPDDVRAAVEMASHTAFSVDEILRLVRHFAEHDALTKRAAEAEAKAAVDRVREMHQPGHIEVKGRPVCSACVKMWPCPTLKALEAR